MCEVIQAEKGQDFFHQTRGGESQKGCPDLKFEKANFSVREAIKTH